MGRAHDQKKQNGRRKKGRNDPLGIFDELGVHFWLPIISIEMIGVGFVVAKIALRGCE